MRNSRGMPHPTFPVWSASELSTGLEHKLTEKKLQLQNHDGKHQGGVVDALLGCTRTICDHVHPRLRPVLLVSSTLKLWATLQCL